MQHIGILNGNVNGTHILTDFVIRQAISHCSVNRYRKIYPTNICILNN